MTINSWEKFENTLYGTKVKEMELTDIKAKWTNGRDVANTLREIVLTFTMPYVPKQKK